MFPDDALRDFSHFKLGIHFNADALELALLLQISDKLLQIGERHKRRQ